MWSSKRRSDASIAMELVSGNTIRPILFLYAIHFWSYETESGIDAWSCDLMAGYLACARCSASGVCLSVDPIVTDAIDDPLRVPTTQRCPNCSGAGKVSQHCVPSLMLNPSIQWSYNVEFMLQMLSTWVMNKEKSKSRNAPIGSNSIVRGMQVMCPTCLCTGMLMASEHDPRIDPFDWVHVLTMVLLSWCSWACNCQKIVASIRGVLELCVL